MTDNGIGYSLAASAISQGQSVAGSDVVIVFGDWNYS